jgi:hypothetical protein
MISKHVTNPGLKAEIEVHRIFGSTSCAMVYEAKLRGHHRDLISG